MVLVVVIKIKEGEVSPWSYVVVLVVVVVVGGQRCLLGGCLAGRLLRGSSVLIRH